VKRVTSVTSLSAPGGETGARRTSAGGLDGGGDGGSISSEGSDGLVPAAFDVRALGDHDAGMHDSGGEYMRVHLHEARPAVNEAVNAGAASHAEAPPAKAHVPIARSVLDQIAFGSLNNSADGAAGPRGGDAGVPRPVLEQIAFGDVSATPRHAHDAGAFPCTCAPPSDCRRRAHALPWAVERTRDCRARRTRSHMTRAHDD